jgi:transcriptional regulator with XRE-family HTH domain
MTQPMREPRENISARGHVIRRMAELRRAAGWSAEEFAQRCRDAGMPHVTRNLVANIETGRRSYIDVNEWLTFAFILNVSPMVLLVPDDDSAHYLMTPGHNTSAEQARTWIRGAESRDLDELVAAGRLTATRDPDGLITYRATKGRQTDA